MSLLRFSPLKKKSLCSNSFDLLQQKANAFFAFEVCTSAFHRQKQGLKMTTVTNANANSDCNGIQLSHCIQVSVKEQLNLTTEKLPTTASISCYEHTKKKSSDSSSVLQWFLKDIFIISTWDEMKFQIKIWLTYFSVSLRYNPTVSSKMSFPHSPLFNLR